MPSASASRPCSRRSTKSSTAITPGAIEPGTRAAIGSAAFAVSSTCWKSPSTSCCVARNTGTIQDRVGIRSRSVSAA
jgi:hypothetical protein